MKDTRTIGVWLKESNTPNYTLISRSMYEQVEAISYFEDLYMKKLKETAISRDEFLKKYYSVRTEEK